MKKMRRIISKTNDGCNFQLTESSVIAFFRACGRPMKNLSAVDFCSQPQEIPLPKPTNLRCFFSYFGFLPLLQSATKLLTHSPFQSSITPILPSFSLCKLTYLPPSPKKRCCIVIPRTFSYKQTTLSGSLTCKSSNFFSIYTFRWIKFCQTVKLAIYLLLQDIIASTMYYTL